MGVHNSRASSLLGLVSLKRHANNDSIRTMKSFKTHPATATTSTSSHSPTAASPSLPNSHLILQSGNPSQNHQFQPILIPTRSLSTLSSNQQYVPFFDPSASNYNLCNNPILIHYPDPFPINHPPNPSSSSSPQSRPAPASPSPSPGSRPTHNHPSGQTSSSPSSKPSNHSSGSDSFQDYHHFNGRSTTSNLSPHNQSSPLTLYSHPCTTHPHQQPDPSKSLLIPRKNLFVFRNGASGIPKNGLHHNSGGSHSSSLNSSIRSKFKKLHSMDSVQVGEDSYFLRSDSLGVADGVGGWSGKPGANPDCSTEVSRYEDVDDVHFLSYNSIDPVEILQQAFERSIHESKLEGLLGSSTALIAILRDDELRIANLGDCCCSVIRGNDFIFRSEEQQHSFNYPVQIGTNSKSTPTKDAQRYNIKVQKDDIIILSSDGLADNLFDEDILEEVLKFTTNPREDPSQSELDKDEGSIARPFTAQMISESLCFKARTVVEDQEAVTSPFSQRANEEGIHYVGGKNDDISVLVAIVGDQNDS